MSVPATASVDLHLHSDVSDGTASPEDVVRRAAAVGLRTIALSDHDDTRGVPLAAEAARAHGVTLVPAIELTARVDARPGGTVHLLGFGIDPESPALLDAARRNRIGKRTQIQSILEKLRSQGVPVTDEEVGLDPTSDRYVGRNKIASALVVRGLAKDRMRAFKKWLKPGARAFAAPEVVSAEEAVAAIRGAGGVVVLAHPTDEDLRRHLPPLLALGLDGIELYRPRAQGALLEAIEAARAQHALLATGGSDWHGLYPEVPLGDWKVDPAKVRGFLERVGVR